MQIVTPVTNLLLMHAADLMVLRLTIANLQLMLTRVRARVGSAATMRTAPGGPMNVNLITLMTASITQRVGNTRSSSARLLRPHDIQRHWPRACLVGVERLDYARRRPREAA